MKLRIRDRQGRTVGVALCSSPGWPDMVARGTDRARRARGVLGDELGVVVLEPRLEGRLDGRSYAVLPYCEPLGTGRLLWPIQRRRVGRAFAGFTAEIRRRAGRVYGLEVVQAQAEFAAERCSQEGLDEVYLACGGDDCRLPYEDGSFDVVILSLVLEWCASQRGEEPAEVVQQRMLSECHRVLREGGTFYVSTKNRYALRLLLGKPDEHAWETPFGSALPRWLLGLVLKLRGKPGPTSRLSTGSSSCCETPASRACGPTGRPRR